jgi:hypothetical protein
VRLCCSNKQLPNSNGLIQQSLISPLSNLPGGVADLPTRLSPRQSQADQAAAVQNSKGRGAVAGAPQKGELFHSQLIARLVTQTHPLWAEGSTWECSPILCVGAGHWSYLSPSSNDHCTH